MDDVITSKQYEDPAMIKEVIQKVQHPEILKNIPKVIKSLAKQKETKKILKLIIKISKGRKRSLAWRMPLNNNMPSNPPE